MNVFGPISRIIAANVSANALMGGRVYPGITKQGAVYPKAAVNIRGVGPSNTKGAPSDLDIVRVQVDVYGETLTATDQAAMAIRAALDYFAGTVNLTGGGTITVKHIQFEREITGFSETPEIFRVIQEYTYVAA